jgi:hypothetical protein
MATRTCIKLGLRASGLLVGLGLVAILGCGANDELGNRYPVSGQVTYNGQNVEKGTINFHPVDAAKGRGANAPIEDGYYSLSTLSAGDGAFPGQYEVTISAVEVDSSKIQEEVSKKGGVQGGVMPPELLARAPRKYLVPQKYGSLSTSGLKAEVKEQSNKFDFPLTD